MTEIEIKKLVNSFRADSCGFNVYVITKNVPKLKKIGFVEEENNLRHKIRNSIIETLLKKFGSEDAQYVSADRIADEQDKFYIINTSEEYDPFAFLKTNHGRFSEDDISDAKGIVFEIRDGEHVLWAYQHLWNISVPNKAKNKILARLISSSQEDVFEELLSPIITFSNKIDLLVIGDSIITSDYKLLQNYFGFQNYIRIRAEKAISTISSMGIVANVEKLTDYVQRGDGKPKYAKKMMRIMDSKVLKMDTDELFDNIHKSSRWNGKLKEKNGQFILENYVQVELLIDLLDERYTKSEITGVEYDTDVKMLAKPV